jgi:hypothetical protein
MKKFVLLQVFTDGSVKNLYGLRQKNINYLSLFSFTDGRVQNPVFLGHTNEKTAVREKDFLLNRRQNRLFRESHEASSPNIVFILCDLFDGTYLDI